MPRSRQRSTGKPVAYAYGSAEKLNAPTTETAARMTDEQISEQPIPEAEAEERVRIPRLQWNRSQLADHARTFGPLYVHDKVSPSEFVGTLLQQNAQADMFADFNGFKQEDGSPADDAPWFPYEYSGHWTNRLIRATGQRAMASLLHKDGLRGRIDLIYIDPPYDIDFKSNFQVSAETPETKETLDDIPPDPLSVKAFRDTYRNGVHSYLDGIYEQLTLARELLAETGAIIVQIGPNNLHQVALLIAEVFGPENHIATIPYQTSNRQSEGLTEVGNWLIFFAKQSDAFKDRKYKQLYVGGPTREDALALWGDAARYEDPDGKTRTLTKDEKSDPTLIPRSGKLFRGRGANSSGTREGRSGSFYLHPTNTPCPDHFEAWDHHSCDSDCETRGNLCPIGRRCGDKCTAPEYKCPPTRHWTVSLRAMQSLHHEGRLLIGSQGGLEIKVYEDENKGKTLQAIWTDAGIVSNKQYIVETPRRVLERCVLMTTDPADLILDLTCGSGAMPVTAETWGRRWIAVDVSAVSIAIARERIATTFYPYHLLKDSPEGHRREHTLTQELLPSHLRSPFEPLPSYGNDPAKGFVYERQTLVTPSTLAYGPDPKEDVIFHPDRTAKNDNVCRIGSAFTVESDSPYRAISPAQADADADDFDVEQTLITQGFVFDQANAVTQRIVSSLETSGILQPGADRFRVENLQPTEMPDVTHTGSLIGPSGERHKAHFYIGAEDEIITALKTGYAAQATIDFRDIEYLVMVSFSRDGDALTTNRRYPRLNILQVNAHRDLQLPHLQEGREDNAFTIVSEPELSLAKQDDGKVCLSVLGLNAFNPATALVEPPNTRNVMGIMVDTAYDGESFRVRLMNVKRVNRNQKTLNDLRAAIDKGGKQVDATKWETIQTNTTVPFDLPDLDVKIAVKVIDQTGTEHMVVLDDPRDAQWYS